jgi:phage tail protein X/stage V sporulation protein SpoVS
MPLDYSNAGSLPTPSAADAIQARSAGYSSSVTIEELTAGPGLQPRMVLLQGPSLPFQGAGWAGENAVVTEWYAGNGDEATQQNLGPSEKPSTWQGRWARTMMGKAPSLARDSSGAVITLVDPDALRERLEDLLRGGTRLRVTWSQASDSPSSRGKLVREGRASAWEFKYVRVQDVEWTITFDWQSRGARVQTVTSVRDGALDASAAQMSIAATDLANQLATAAFIQSNSAIYKSATQLTLGQLESIAAAPSAVANSLQRSVLQVEDKMKQVVTIAQTLESQPQAVTAAAVNIAKNAVALAQQFVDQMGEVPFETMQTAGKGSVHDLLRSYRYFGRTSEAAYAAALAAQEVVRQLQQRAPSAPGAGGISPQSATAQEGDMLTVYVTKDGDTPARISLRFYGSMDHGVDILQANRLPWHQPTFPKGKPLFIPRLKSQQKTS